MTRRWRHLQIGLATVAAVLGPAAFASASTLGGMSTSGVSALEVTRRATVPRIRVADAFTTPTFLSGRLPQDRAYLGGTWSVTAGSWSISAAGAAVPQPGVVNTAIYDVGATDIVTSVSLTRKALTSAGIVVRSNPAGSTYLLAEFRNVAGGSVTLHAIVDGVSTPLASASNAGTLSVVPISVEAWGNLIVVRYDSVPVLSYTLIGDWDQKFNSSTSPSTWTGLSVSNGVGESFDNFRSATWPAS